jgi:hypothetical protein
MPVPDFSPGEVLTAAAMDSIGLWKVGSFSGNGTSNTITCDNVFTSDYQNYRVTMSINPAGVAGVAAFIQFLNTSGTPVTANYFSSIYSQDYASGTSGFGTMRSTTVAAYIGWVPSTGGFMHATFDVFRPRETAQTGVTGSYVGINSGTAYAGGQIMTQTTVTTQMRGFRMQIDTAPNVTGTIRVYGYRD